MASFDDLQTKSWGKAAASVITPVMLSRGTLESTDFAKTRALAEVLGFDCVDPAPGRMLLRHRSDRSGGTYLTLEVRAVASITTPQNMTNHWGIWVPTRQDVDDAYDLLAAHQEELGLVRVQKPRQTHVGGRDYSFYFEDESHNWWEIGEHPDEAEFVDLVAHGDWDQRGESSI
jgi:hypothetical protein